MTIKYIDARMHKGLQCFNKGLAVSVGILQDIAAELELCKLASLNHFSTCHSSYDRLHMVLALARLQHRHFASISTHLPVLNVY